MTISRREFVQCLPFVVASNTLYAAGTVDLQDMLLERARSLAADSKLELDILLPQGSESNVLPIARAFTLGTGVELKFSTVTVDDINSKLLLASALDQRVDVALPATFGIPDLVEAGALYPLDAFQANFETENAAEKSLFTLGDYYNEQLYGFQTDGDVYLMFYNRAILEDEKLREQFEQRFGRSPAPARTWAELDQMLQFYHQPQRGLFGGALFRTPGYIAWEYWIRLHSKGRLPFDSAMRPQLNTREGIAAAEELAEASRFLTPTARSADLFQNWSSFSSGNVMCNIGWGGSQKFFRSNGSRLPKGVLTAATPYGDDSDSAAFAYFNWGWNYAVPRTSQHPEIAFLFSRFASLPESSTTGVRAADGFFDPFHQSHYEDPVIQRTYGRQFLDVHRESMGLAIPDLYLRGRNQYMAILSNYLLQIDRREISPSVALKFVSEQWDEITDTLGRSEQSRQWALLYDRYPEGMRATLS